MKGPLVSIKMLTYNHAPYIAKAIECVLAQKTTFPFELVIGEDCSTDGTREIVFGYAQRFPEIIRVITSDQNVGLKKNSSRVSADLRGKYIAWCEGDDYWHRDDKLQLQVDVMEAHPECGLVCSDYDALNVITGERITALVAKKGWKVPSSRSMEDFLARHGGNNGTIIGGSIRTLTVMARRELVNKLMEADPYLYSKRFLMGDTQLWAELNSMAEVMFISESLATHSVLPNSASKSNDPVKRLRFLLNGSELFLYLCDKHNISKDVRQLNERLRLKIMLWLAYHEQDEAMANTVRDNQGLTNVKEWIQYYSVTNKYVHLFYSMAKRVTNKIIIKKQDWV